MEPNGKRWLDDHPIVPADRGRPFVFSFAGQPVVAHPGDVISSALFASGIRTFGRHPRDGSPQGIYCANGQCSQCMVLANGQPVK
jgi:sarcosine oxidase subunit alpha